jgi:hypothetical protein
MPVNILNLSAYRVTGVEEAEHDCHVLAEIVDPPSRCRECGSDRIAPRGVREAVIERRSEPAQRIPTSLS